VCVSIGKGCHPSYVRVIVSNSSHRAWGKMGKQFDTKEQAVSNYKTGSIKAMIEHACKLAHAEEGK